MNASVTKETAVPSGGAGFVSRRSLLAGGSAALGVAALVVASGAEDASALADPVLNSYPAASLPPAGTAGRLARLSDGSRGPVMDTGAQWYSIMGGVRNVREFGALANGSNDGPAIQAALDAAAGGVVYLPPGNYTVTQTLYVPPNTTMVGAGMNVSTILVKHNGNGLIDSTAAVVNPRVRFPLNGSTAAYVSLANLAIQCDNANLTTTGGFGFHELAGTYVYFDQVRIAGFSVQLGLDQTEICAIDRCVFELSGPMSRMGVWIINGPDATAGSNGGYTNRIAIRNCQFNAASGAVAGNALLRDDGGVAHTVENCNFNGGGYAVIAAGTGGFRFVGNEVEACSQTGMFLTTNTFSGTFRGSNRSILIQGNMFHTPFVAAISINSAAGGSILANAFFGYSGPAITLQTDAIAQLLVEGNSKSVDNGLSVDPFVGPISGAASRLAAQILRQKNQTFSLSALAAGTRTVTPRTMGVPATAEAITVGSRLLCINNDGTNGEYVTVSAVTATTFTATFALGKNANFVVLGC